MALNRITHGRASLEARRRLAIDVEAVGDDLDGDGTEAVAAKPRSKGGRFTRILASSWLILIISFALLAPILPIPDPKAGGLGVGQQPFGDFILGTDHLGRDMFSRIVFGARMSLFIGVLSVGIAMTVGVGIGLFAGYLRGKLDTGVTAVADVVAAFPGLVFLLVISSLAGSSIRNLILAIALFQFPMFIRLGRASTINYAQREFVSAAKGLGARDLHIATREILPNVIPAVTAYALAAIGIVFVVEGSLSFLGFGIQPPTPAWGSMIAAGRPHLVRTPHIVLVPATVLFLTVLSFNALADARRTGGRPLRLGT